MGFEGLGHGGLEGESTVGGHVRKTHLWVLVDKADGVTHAVLANHVVKRLITTPVDDFRKVFVAAMIC